MRLIITSDIHFGVPNKLEHSLWAAKTIREYAAANKIETILVLGDLFHDRTNLNIQVLTTAYDFFNSTDQDYNQEWIAFPGNHDLHMKNSWKVNSVRPLNRVLTIIEDVKRLVIDGINFWIIPFVHYESAFMQVVRAVEEKASENDILLTHIGVNGAKSNECFLLKYWNLVDFSNSKFYRIYTGHFHNYQKVGDKTWYPGSPIPFRFDEGLAEHGFLVFDTVTKEHEFVGIFKAAKEHLPIEVPAPDYLTCTDEDIDKINVANNNVRVYLSRDYTSNELYELRSQIINRGALAVKWMKEKQEEDEELQVAAQSNLGDGTILFSKWLEHDRPKHLDHQQLLKLNKDIVEEGLEIISSEGTDGDST